MTKTRTPWSHTSEVSYEDMSPALTQNASDLPTPEEALFAKEQTLMEEFGLTYMQAYRQVRHCLYGDDDPIE